MYAFLFCYEKSGVFDRYGDEIRGLLFHCALSSDNTWSQESNGIEILEFELPHAFALYPET
jgi:hypothetical protein